MSYDFDKGIIRERIQEGVAAIFSEPDGFKVHPAFTVSESWFLTDKTDHKSPESRANTKGVSDYDKAS